MKSPIRELKSSMKVIALLSLLLMVTNTPFTSFEAESQAINVTVNIPPPYPVHLEDYMGQNNTIILTLTNLSNSVQNFKLIPTITGNNGVSATIKQSYQPNTPIVLNPFETTTMSYAQLQSYNGAISENDLELTNYSVSQMMQSEALPEGMYTVCVVAYDYNTNQKISSDFGCANFLLSWYDPPVIISPINESDVEPQTPQFLNFNWIPAGVPGITNYKFELVDMTQNQLFNPNDAFDNLSVFATYTENFIIANSLVYDFAKPPLIEGHEYALRITAHDPNGSLVFKNQGKSTVTTFTYESAGLQAVNLDLGNNDINDLQGNQGMQVVLVPWNNNNNWLAPPPPPPDDDDENPAPVDPEDDPGCQAQCNVAQPSNAGNVIVDVGDEVVIGKFVMEVKSDNNNNSGTGEIFISWLKTPVTVKFNNIQVNNQMQMYGGEVFAEVDGGGIPESLAKSENADLSQLGNQLADIKNFVNQASRKVSQFSQNNNIPIGVPFTLDNNDFQLAIVGLIFEPTQAYMNALLPIQVPESVDAGFLSIHASGICLRPNGVGLNGGKIYLNQPVTTGLSDHVDLTFNQGQNNTYLEFDCQGVTEVQIDGKLVFDNDIMLPLNNNGDVQNGEVEAQFTVQINDADNWMADNVTMVPEKFTTPAVKGFVFSAQNLKFDHSDLSNPAGMQNAFPQNYPNTSNTWRGLYIEQLSCQLP